MSQSEPREQEAQVILALHELLAGRQVPVESTTTCTDEVKACLDALADALQSGGVGAVRKAFTALAKDRPWLMQLASRQPPDQQGSATQTRRIRFVDDDAFECRPQRHWLIPYLIPKSGIVLVYGPPGCGKSFLTMAWSLCIATGTQWLGHPVTRGPVAYIAAEGSFGLGPRIKAWKAHHGFIGNSGVRWFDESLTLTDSSSFDALSVAQECGDLVAVVATGTTKGSRTPRWISLLSQQERVLVAFDAEREKGDADAGWSIQRLGNVRRLRPLWMDANQMLRDGADLRSWVSAALVKPQAPVDRLTSQSSGAMGKVQGEDITARQ